MKKSPFGKALKKALIDVGITYKKLGEELQVSPAYISSLSSGKKNVSNVWIKKIEDYFLEKHNYVIPELRLSAVLSNKGCLPITIGFEYTKKRVLVYEIASTDLTDEQINAINRIIKR